MELVDHSRRYRSFYAPAFAIRLAGADIVRNLLVPVSQIEVDLVLNAASRFSFTLSNCYDAEKQMFVTGRGKELLSLIPFGAGVEVCLGYGDGASTPTVFLGMVTNVSTNFSESGSPELAISGYDHAFPLTLGKSSESWQERTDSDVVNQIASFHNLKAAIDRTTEKHPQIEQNQQSDWDFLKKLAERNSDEQHHNHFEVYVDPGGAAKQPTLHFGKPRMDDAPVAILKQGSGLLSFKPEANLGGQVSKVEVYGWDIKGKRQIVGRASADDAGPQRKSVGQVLNSLVREPSKAPTLRLRQPVFTQAEADKRAKAALSEMTRKFLTADAESIGLPELRPDRTIRMENLGKDFSKTYYIEQATHRIDSSGYRTRFKVRETDL